MSHAVGFGKDHVKEHFPYVLRHITIFKYRLGGTAYACKRRAHFVRYVRDKFASGFFKLIAAGYIVYDRNYAFVIRVVFGVSDVAEVDVKDLALIHYIAFNERFRKMRYRRFRFVL